MVEGNEAAEAAESAAEAVERALLREASLTNPTRVATEAKSQSTKHWIASYINNRRGYKQLKGSNI